ncbi:MAG TPA: YdcF family protein [Melioribacteraceae bacterium]|nr:YdcF family protein [Melioribacteraceae bacterium]
MKRKFQYTGIILFVLLISIVTFLFLSFIKYKLNGLSVSEYRMDYIGNILNLIVPILLVAGLVAIIFTKRQIDKKRINLLLVIQILSFISLFVSFILFDFIKLASNEFIFNFPVKKVYTGFLMIVTLFLQIYSLIYVWGFILLGIENYFEIRTIIRSILAILLLLLFSMFYVWNINGYSIEPDSKEKYQYALIPGAAVWQKHKPSPIFEGRIRKGLNLYRSKLVDKLILTGGNAPGELSEAEVAYKFLTNLGVDFKDLIVEQSTSTTNEQIKFLKSDKSINKSSTKVLIVSDDFHLARTLQICRFFNVEADGISTDYKLTFEKTLFYRTRESIALLLFWFFAI